MLSAALSLAACSQGAASSNGLAITEGELDNAEQMVSDWIGTLNLD